MSIKDRLTRKTAGIVQAARNSQHDQSDMAINETPILKGSIDQKMPRTGPGQMLAFRTHMQENSAKVQELEDRLRAFDGSLPVRKIDPSTIGPSRWANRHESSFLNAAFAELKREIEIAGGNIQPILVRPLPNSIDRFEVVFGHRRHQACLQLNLPVLAVIDVVTDRELFTAMDRENRARADLSPFEQGEMYRRALDEGLFPSLRMLCAEVGVDPGNVSKAISIARLPLDVLAAFQSPIDIQFRWGQLIQKALDNDAESVLNIARELSRLETKLSSRDVVDKLIGHSRKLRASTVDFSSDGKSVGRMNRATDGSIQIALKSGVLNDDQFKQLHDYVKSLVRG